MMRRREKKTSAQAFARARVQRLAQPSWIASRTRLISRSSGNKAPPDAASDRAPAHAAARLREVYLVEVIIKVQVQDQGEVKGKGRAPSLHRHLAHRDRQRR